MARNIISKEEIEMLDMEYIECSCGYHLGIDGTYLEQVGDSIIICPSCQEELDTKVIIA